MSPAEVVHQGVVYDVVLDTPQSESLAWAQIIAAHIR